MVIKITKKGKAASDARVKLLVDTHNKIFGDGLTEEEYDKIKNRWVGPGQTIKGYVESLLDSASAEWRNGILTERVRS